MRVKLMCLFKAHNTGMRIFSDETVVLTTATLVTYCPVFSVTVPFSFFFSFLVHTLSRHVQDRGVLGLSPLVHTLPRHVQDHCVLGNVFGQVCLPEMPRTAVFSVTIVCCNVPFSLVLSLSVCMPRLRFFCCEIMASPRSCPLLV